MASANDHTPAIQAALATGKPVRLLPGRMRVTSPLICATQGQRIEGHGRAISIIMVDAAFQASAQGVFVINTGETAPEFHGFGVSFVQVDTSSLAALTPFPPAFQVINSARGRFIDIRILAGMIGINFVGNCGGSTVVRLESSCLRQNIAIDGSFDSMRIEGWHVFPTGLTASQQAIFYSVDCIGLNTGRCDDLKLLDSLFLCGRAINSYPTTLPVTGGTTGTVSGCAFDTYGNVTVSGGWLQFVGNYFTLVNGVAAITQTGSCELDISGNRFEIAGGTPSAGYVVQAGSNGADPCILSMSGNLFDTGSADVSAVQIVGTAISVDITGNIFRRSLAGVFGAPALSVGPGGNGVISGNQFSSPGQGGSGPAMAFAGDASYLVEGNYCGNRAILTPFQTSVLDLCDNFALGGADLVNNNLAGVSRTISLHVIANATGNSIITHGISDLHKRLLHLTVLARAADGSAVPLVAQQVTPIQIVIAGAPANARLRVSFAYSDYIDAWV